MAYESKRGTKTPGKSQMRPGKARKAGKPGKSKGYIDGAGEGIDGGGVG